MLIFVVSDDMSHTVSPRPGKHEEQPVGVKSTEDSEKNTTSNSCGFALSLLLSALLYPLFSFPF